MRIEMRVVAVVALMALLAACAQPRNLFVLLPEADGSVGKIVISNAQGSQVLDKALQASGVDAADDAPRRPFDIAEKDVREIFSGALAAEPEAPISFILYFRTGGTELAAESKRQLPDILRLIGERQAPRVGVVGHTDRAGSEKINAILALERAQLVRDMLIAIGVDQNDIDVSSHGEANLLVPTANGVNEPKNRRVEVTVK